MTEFKFVKPERISLKNHPVLNEQWVADQIANDPQYLPSATSW